MITINKKLMILLIVATIGFGAAIVNGAIAIGGSTPLLEVSSDGIKAPALASAPGDSGPKCPAGWENLSARDEHSRVVSCAKGGWVVILQESGAASHAYQPNTPNAKFLYPGETDWVRVGWPK
jgi:hypothetical protein